MAYLSTIKDGSTNEILAYNLSNRITLDIAIGTIYKLMKKRNFTLHKDAFIHSELYIKMHLYTPIKAAIIQALNFKNY